MGKAVSGIINATNDAREYDKQKRMSLKKADMSRVMGLGQKNQAYANASGIDTAARLNAGIAGQQQRQMRKNQAAAAGGADAARSGSGFDVGSGSGGDARAATVKQYDDYISNMAQSSSIASVNALQRALDTRREGDMAERMAEIDAIGYEGEAEVYKIMAKTLRKGAIKGAVYSTAGALVGGVFGGGMGASMGADLGWQLGTGLDPTMAKYSGADAGTWNSALSMFSGGGGAMGGFM